MAPTKVAAGLVVYRKLSGKIEYLLLQTSYGIHHWTPPKGHVDPGESLMETALRETKEESGLEQSDLKIHDKYEIKSEYLINTTLKKVHYWIAEIANPNTPVRLSDEHQDYKWAELEEACKLAEFQETQSLLKKCDEYLKSL